MKKPFDMWYNICSLNKKTTHQKVMKRIVEKSTQNVNSNAGIFLAKQILDRLPSFAKFDNDEVSRRSVANRIYST